MTTWLRLLLACVVLVGSASLAHSAGSEQTHGTLPQGGASFLPDLQNFLKREDAQRYGDMFTGMVTSGGIHGTVAALTATPSDAIAYPGGYYTSQVGGSVTYTANKTCYVIIHKDNTGNLLTFTRSVGTNYLVDCASASKPTLPANSAWLMQVFTNSSAVTVVVDLRSRTPDIASYLFAELPTADHRGRLAFVRDVGSVGTLFYDKGNGVWDPLTTNPMTTQGDLIVGANNGIPSRLARGTSAAQFLGMNDTALAVTWRTLAAGSGLSLSCTVTTCTFTQTTFPPAGSITLYAHSTPPAGWLICDGAEILLNTYPSLAAVLVPNASTWGRGTKVADLTCDSSTDICTANGHGLADAQIVHVDTTTTLPGNLTTNTVLYIRDSTLNTFKLTFTSGGTAIDITSAGSGVHHIYDHIQTPDFRGRAAVGIGTGSGLSARTLGTMTGKETIAVSDLPTHGHLITDPGHTHSTLALPADTTGVTAAPGGTNAISSAASGVNTTGITIQAGSCPTCNTASDGNMMPTLVMNYIIKS